MTMIHHIRTKSGINDFINYPYQLYKDNSFWVPPLKYSEKNNIDTLNNPFYKNIDVNLYLAKRGKKVVGRIASIYDKRFSKGYFGFLHAENNPEVFKLLLKQAEKDLEQKNIKEIIGPVSPSINYEMGVLIKGFLHSPFLMMPYNFDYYDNHIKSSGYKKAKDFYAYYANKNEIQIPDKVVRVMNLASAKFNVKLRNPNMEEFIKEIEKIELIYNNAMADHWGFVQMELDELKHLANTLKNIIDPRMVLIAEIANQPIGFIMCLPDYNEIFKKIRNGKLFPTGILTFLLNRRKIGGLRVVMLGVRRKFQPKGIGSLLYFQAIKNMLSSQYRYVEFSWIMENNLKVQKIAESIGAKCYKTYRLYSKSNE